MARTISSQGMTRRAFGVSFGAGIYVVAMPITGNAALKKVPTSTGIDALFAPFVVAAERKMFEKYDLETSFKPFDDGNIALDALLTGSSDIGATTEFGGLSRWDKGGKLYVTYDIARQFPGYGAEAGATSSDFADRIIMHIRKS